MADKWADYVITAVRFNPNGTHIQMVQLRTDDGQQLSAAYEATRTEVIHFLEQGYTLCTALHVGGDGVRKGAAVKIVEIDGDTFIRTRADNTRADNLGRLPGF